MPLPYDARFTYNGLSKRDADFKAYMTAYDKQLTDFTTMFWTKEYSSSWEQDEEHILIIRACLQVGGSCSNDTCVLNANTTTRKNMMPIEILANPT
ncbi:MAG TPA: hypothetical protein VFI70_12080 [Nitrososphaeraceae archaeon]|nr:hypothetical protein [Nitrososphaeraceae archaeon]